MFDILQSQYQNMECIKTLTDNLNKRYGTLNEEPTDPIDETIAEIEELNKERHGENNIKGKIICISGSTRFKPQIVAMKKALEKYGAIVLTPEYYSHYEGVELTEKQLDVLEKVHMEKLKGCDLHVVIAESKFGIDIHNSSSINANSFTVGESVHEELIYTLDHYIGTLIVPISPMVIDIQTIEKIANHNARLIANEGYKNAVFTAQSFSNYIVLDDVKITE